MAFSYDYDPLAQVDRILDVGATPRPKKRKQPLLAPLPEDQKQSFLSKIGSDLLSGVGYVAGFIDKTLGDRAIRGVLGGKPQEILSIIPGSDTFGITNRRNEVTGRDLLEKAGVLEKNQPGLDWGDVAGFAADVALSPSSYVAPFALKGGRILEAIGKVPKGFKAGMSTKLGEVLKGLTPEARATAESFAKAKGWDIAAEADKPIRGLLGLGKPFSRHSDVVFGFGPKSQAAAKVVDTAASTARWSPVGQKISQMFSPRAGNRMGKDWQKMYGGFFDKVAERTVEAKQYAAWGHGVRTRTGTADMGEMEKLADDFITNVAENVPNDPKVFSKLAPVAKELTDLAKSHQAKFAEAKAGYLAAGGDINDLPNYFTHIFNASPEQLAAHGKRSYGSLLGGRMETNSPFSMARKGYMKGPFKQMARSELNTLGQDTYLATAGRGAESTSAATRHIMRRYFGMSDDDIRAGEGVVSEVNAMLAAGKPVDNATKAAAEAFAGAQGQAKGLANFAEKAITNWHIENGVAPFSLYTESAVQKYLSSIYRATESLNAQTAALGQTAMQAGKAGAEATVTLERALKWAGMKSGKYANPRAVRNAAIAMGDNSVPWESLAGVELAKATARFAKTHVVPREFAQQLLENRRLFGSPKATSALASAWDQFTALFKAGVTTAPAFYQRNLNSGFFTAAHIGAYDPRYRTLNPMRWIRPWLDAKALSKGGVVPGAAEIEGMAEKIKSAGLAPKTTAEADAFATQILRHELYARGTVGRMQGQALEEVPDIAGITSRAFKERLVGETPTPSMWPWSIARRAVPRSLEEVKPWNVAGFGGRTETGFSIVREGRGLNTYIEHLNRMAPYIAKRRQGLSSKAAHDLVTAANGDYAAVAKTVFERKWMGRIYPFYTFLRRMSEFYGKELLMHPGSLAMVATKATKRARERDQFTPDYIAQGLALPIGHEKDGTQRFLSNLDLPHESVFRMLRPGATVLDTVSGTLQEFAGQANPLLKVPAELASNTSFFTGRKLSDMDSSMGRISQNVLGLKSPPYVSPVFEELLASSPLTRGASIIRTITDPRKRGILEKGINLTTGVRITDVDMGKAKKIAVRDYVRKRLAGKPGISTFEDFYTRPEQVPNLSAEDILLLRLNKSMRK